jgi:excisionase family DNA binding protein
MEVGEMQKLLTISEAADLLRISKSKIYQLVADRKIPVVRLDTRILFLETQLESFIQGQCVQPSSR